MTALRTTRRHFGVALSSIAVAFALAGCASSPAPDMMFKADLSGASEVPPVATAAKGVFTAKYIPANGLLLWNMS